MRKIPEKRFNSSIAKQLLQILRDADDYVGVLEISKFNQKKWFFLLLVFYHNVSLISPFVFKYTLFIGIISSIIILLLFVFSQ